MFVINKHMEMSDSKINDVYKYWNDRPCNVRHSNKSQDSVEYFDEVAAKKFRVESNKHEFLALEKWKGKRVLELGCGLGTDAVQFAKAGASVVCVDLTDSGIALCRTNFELHGLSGEFFIGDIEKLDEILPASYKNSFDLIYSFGVIHHTPNPSNVFRQIPQFLAPSGEVRCMLYSRFSYKLFWLMDMYDSWKFSDVDSLVQNYSEAQSGCPVTYTFTFDEVKKILEPELEVVNIWKDHIFIWNIEKYKQNIFEPDAPFKDVNPAYLRAMEKELGWHTMFIAKKA